MIEIDRVAFLDGDTQFDFVAADGALSIAGAEALRPAWAKLIQFAVDRRIPVVAAVDTHTPDDPEFAVWPPHCVKGTPGHEKVPETVIPGARRIPLGGPAAPYRPGETLIVEKSIYSVFDNPNTLAILEAIGRPNYVVFGVATDYCVRAAVLGLREHGYGVFLVRDAIMAVGDPEEALAEMVAAGAQLVDVADVLAAV